MKRFTSSASECELSSRLALVEVLSPVHLVGHGPGDHTAAPADDGHVPGAPPCPGHSPTPVQQNPHQLRTEKS